MFGEIEREVRQRVITYEVYLELEGTSNPFIHELFLKRCVVIVDKSMSLLLQLSVG